MTFEEYCEQLEQKIQDAYTNGISLEDAEKLAGEFLVAQMRTSRELKNADLDSRMKKSGLKAVRATAYRTIAANPEKKPTEAAIAAAIDVDPLVGKEQDSYDAAEVDKASLERYFNVFQNAHIFYRGVAKG